MVKNSSSGQARILEAVIAAILIFITFSAAFFMLFSSERVFKQEVVDLNRLAHNILHRLAELGVIDEALKDSEADTGKLMSAIQSLLPQSIYFNITISAVGNPGRSISVSNAPQSMFEGSGEVASASIIYTSKRGLIYRLTLKLTRAGLV
ncbi:MAG: hypothetical protein QW186_06415 [Candidatus Bathyarchaeia archaeon]